MGKVEDLEKRIEQLEAQLEAAKPKPEPPPFVPKPHQHWDPTQAMSPPVRLTGREVYKKQSIEEANMEYSKDKNPVGTLMPLAEWLKQHPPAEPTPPSPNVGVTIPVDSKRPGQDLADAIAQGFANREKAEELAKLIDVANKLKGL
jgi:hypothetical protein